MRLFITGGTGFIGKHLVKLAVNKGHKVTVLSRKPINDDFAKKDNFENILLDIKEIHKLSLLNFDVFINLAAVGVSPQLSHWGDFLDVDISASLKICQKAKEIGARVLQIGSYCEYGRSAEKYNLIPVDAPLKPTFPYAVSKATSYQLTSGFANSENLELAYLRLFNVFGDGQFEKNLWPSLRIAALNNENFELTPGQQIRDFISVEEVSRIILKVAELPSSFFEKTLVLNVGSGEPKSILQFCKEWWAFWEAKGELKPGAIKYRKNEVMRYVPYIEKEILF